MVSVEFKQPDKKVKYADVKRCIYKREIGETTSEECKKTFQDAGIID